MICREHSVQGFMRAAILPTGKKQCGISKMPSTAYMPLKGLWNGQQGGSYGSTYTTRDRDEAGGEVPRTDRLDLHSISSTNKRYEADRRQDSEARCGNPHW